MLRSIKKLFRKNQNKLSRKKLAAQVFDPETIETILQVQAFTMTSPERIAALCAAVKHVVFNAIPGAVVECGVWRGGSMMAVAKTLAKLQTFDRDLFLCDTFEGMSPPRDQDVAFDGVHAKQLLAEQDRNDSASIWCVSGLEEVQKHMASTQYAPGRIHFIPGKVEDTLPIDSLDQIALLRLDTDWYESTRHELEHLFPRLVPGGVLIIDDYGHWQGARRAVDEYFSKHRVPIFLHRVDYTGRIGVVSTNWQKAA